MTSTRRRTQGQGLPVNTYRTVLQRSHQVVGGVLECEEVAAVLEVHQVRNRDERLDRAVSRAGAMPGERCVNTMDAVLHSRDRVRALQEPETSMPISRAAALCCAEMSASVQWVAIRTERTPIW